MRFKSVKAFAFGPFHNETLELAPGMNLVYGPNEAGKSSWHAALYAGLCGVRRGQGPPTMEDRKFANRHKPWSGSEWKIGVTITLDDGRVVILTHDLAGRMDSSARNADIAGHDYSNEIINDGAPDGAHWLGLNRRTFLSTACVRQADMLSLLSNPDILQKGLQRAAATAGGGRTAAAALELLASYRKDKVGSARAPTKPLIQSEEKVNSAKKDLSKAQEAHESYMECRANVEKREQEKSEAQRKADAVAAVLAEEDAARAEQDRDRARELQSKFPEGAPHPSPELNEVASQVTAALTNWESRPAVEEPGGLAVAEYDRRIASDNARLIAAKAAVAEQEAQDAERRMERIQELHGLFPNGQPPRVSAEEQKVELQVRDALRDWEHWSSRPLPSEPLGASIGEIERELADFDARVAPRRSSSRIPLLATASVLVSAAGIGLAAFLPEFQVVGLSLLAAGAVGVVGTLIWPLATRSRKRAQAAGEQAVREAGRNGIAQRLEDRRKEEDRHQAESERYSAALERLDDAAGACGIDAEEPAEQAQALRDWQEARHKRLRRNDEMSNQWDELQQLLGVSSPDEIAKRTERLRKDAADLITSADVELLTDARTQNLSRERLAELEGETKKNHIEWEGGRIRRQAADEKFRTDCKRIKEAKDSLHEAAEAAQVQADDAEGLAAALRDWQELHRQSVAEAEQRARLWDELQSLLAGRSLNEIAAEAERLRADADKRTAEVGPDALAYAKSESPSRSLLESLRSEARKAEGEWNLMHGQLLTLGRSLPSVADAEDDLAAAQHEMKRVRQLDKTLETAIKFLKAAQDKVHRDIAPELRNTMLEWLPQVTNGRYTDCLINPANLLVEVAGPGGQQRDAARLSHGTAEQVYLLLRLALARHLTASSGETCPLILDDAVGASDYERKRKVLETLLAISESTQVILFTHEDDVRDWAHARLTDTPHRLVELDRSNVAA